MNQLVMERTTAPTRRARASAAPRPVGATTPARTRQPHEWRTLVTVALGVSVVLLAAMWSFAQGWGRGPVAGPGELAVDGGIVRVDGVVSAARPQHAMPGMGSDEDPVAEGMRRISVDVTLMAGTSSLEFDVDRFGLSVDGEAAAHLTHRDVLPTEELPAGTRLSGSILFDVPADATAATLTYAGAEADVVLPPETEPVPGAAPAAGAMTDAGHGTQGHDGGAASLDETTETQP